MLRDNNNTRRNNNGGALLDLHPVTCTAQGQEREREMNAGKHGTRTRTTTSSLLDVYYYSSIHPQLDSPILRGSQWESIKRNGGKCRNIGTIQMPITDRGDEEVRLRRREMVTDGWRKYRTRTMSQFPQSQEFHSKLVE